jgi:hypothetical protein
MAAHQIRHPLPFGIRDGVVHRRQRTDAALLHQRGRPASGPSAEDERTRQCRAADAVAAVNAPGRLAGSEEAVDAGPAVDVNLEAAEPGVAARRHFEWHLRDVNAA